MTAPAALGFIGIGLMGRPMVLRLLDAGHRVTVWNRSRDKLAPVLARGAVAAETPAALARAADVVMVCVTDQRSVHDVLFGADGVAVGGAGQGRGRFLQHRAGGRARVRRTPRVRVRDGPGRRTRVGRRAGCGEGNACDHGGWKGRARRARAPARRASRPALHADGRFRRRPGNQVVQPGHRRIAAASARRSGPPRRGRGGRRCDAARGAARRLGRFDSASGVRSANGRAPGIRRWAPPTRC